MRESIAHYNIISRIGSGGMGAVYLAQDTKLDRHVALKILLDEVAADEDRVRRFIQEAKAASALNHPNILTVHEIGDFEHSKYIATELVDGQTLRDRLQIGVPTLREALDVTLQVATALNAAHSAGIVHRDIKPENIMIRNDGIVKVLDFGLAKLLETPEDSKKSGDSTRGQVNTLPGVILGTVLYMSPEQARGKETDARSDIWSLAIVLYEMLSGTTPFAGETANDTVAAILIRRPHMLSAIPSELQRILKKALQKEADERYQTVKDLLLDVKILKRELERSEDIELSYLPHTTGSSKVSTGEMSEKATAIYDAGAISTDEARVISQQISGAELVTSTIRQHKVGATALFAVIAIVLAGFGYGLYRFVEKSKVEPTRQLGAFKTQRLTGDGKTPGAEISPDGKFLAFLKLDGGSQSLWIKQIQTNSTIQIVGPGSLMSFWGITFSPDGNFVYFNARGPNTEPSSVYRAPSLGGSPTKVFSNANLAQFSQDGSQVVFVRLGPRASETSIVIANADGSNERVLASMAGQEFFTGSPVWSPDGKYIAVGYGNTALAPNPTTSIKLISVADRSLSDLGSFRWSGVDLAWHPSGDSLIVTGSSNSLVGSQIWEVSYPSGAVRRLTDNLSGYYTISITSDGQSIVSCESYSRSAVWVSPDLKPEDAKQIMTATADTWGLSWTPDNRIVFASDQTGDNEIWIMDADGSNAKPLTEDRVFKIVPVVSPDGRYIVYISANNGRQMERIDIGGSDHRVFGNAVYPDNPDISLDSKWVIFDALDGGVSKIFRMPIDGGPPERLTDVAAIEPRYSNDGTRFACILMDEKTQAWGKLAIYGAEGGAPTKVFDLPPATEVHRGPVWTPDDLGITFIVAQGEKLNLWLQPLEDSAAKQITNFGSPVLYRRQYSRDGKRVAIIRGEGIGNAIMITGFR